MKKVNVVCVMPDGSERIVRVSRGCRENPTSLNGALSVRVGQDVHTVSGDVVYKYNKYRFIPKGVNAHVCY